MIQDQDKKQTAEKIEKLEFIFLINIIMIVKRNYLFSNDLLITKFVEFLCQSNILLWEGIFCSQRL